MSEIKNQLLTIEQLAKITGFTPKAIRCWCQRGDVFPTARKIPNIPKGQWRILSDDVALLEMLDGHTDNAALLADQNKQIIELGNQIELLKNQLAEQREVAQKNQDNLWDRIEALEPYKKHYEQQQRKRAA